MLETELIDEIRINIDTFTERWSKIQRNSMKSIQAVTNTFVQLEHLEGSLGELADYDDIKEKTKGKLIAILFDKLVPSLETSMKDFTKLMKLHGQAQERVSGLRNIFEEMRGNEPSTADVINFLEHIIIAMDKTLSMYEDEFMIKSKIYKDVEDGHTEMAVITNYLTIWMAEPYIEPDTITSMFKIIDEYLDELSTRPSPYIKINHQPLQRR